MAGNRPRKFVRQSRSLSIALSPRAERYTQRHPYRLDGHGRSRTEDSDYPVHLKEKQRSRAQYGIREVQIRRAWEEARRAGGPSDENLVELFEMRLDALVLHAGFARTIAQTRQVVIHRHLLVDGKIINHPFFQVKPGQTVQTKPRSQTSPQFHVVAQGVHRGVLPRVPGYLDVDLEKLRFILTRQSKRAEVPVICDVQTVVEYYSR